MEIFVQYWVLELAFFLPAMIYICVDEHRRSKGTEEKPVPSLPGIGWALLVLFLSGLCLACGGIHLVVSSIIDNMVVPNFPY